MPKEEFDNYLSEYISQRELEALLKLVKEATPGEVYFVLSVKDSGDGMVSGEAKTWMQISNSRADKLCYMLQDDDGKTELNLYDITVSGLADCLDNLSSLQDELSVDEFWDQIKKSL